MILILNVLESKFLRSKFSKIYFNGNTTSLSRHEDKNVYWKTFKARFQEISVQSLILNTCYKTANEEQTLA